MPKISRSIVVGSIIALTLFVGFLAYTVKPGDTLSEIAQRSDVSVAELIELNGISNPNLIRAGQVLLIPDASGVTTPAAAATHIVVTGDTLGKIARKYGVTVAQLMDSNGITNPNRIYLGASIVVNSTAPAPFVNLANDSTDLTHLVTSGQSLAKIAGIYDVTISELLSANTIPNPDLIRVGQEIAVPGVSRWRCPVPNGAFINDWGFPRSGGRTHKGTDIFAPRGSDVVAPVSGEAEQIDGTIGGLQVRLWGDDGHVYWLTHLDSFAKGGRVNAGDVIGFVGDSGNALGSQTHVHFEIHPDNGAAANPFPTLEDACN